MKKIFFTALSLLIIATNIQIGHADEQTDSLKQALANYKQAVLENNVSTILDYTYPAVFGLASREDMQAGLEQMAASGQAPNVTKLDTSIDSPIQVFSKGTFATVTADTAMTMPSPEPENDEMNELILSTLKTQMGADSEVSFNAEQGIFNISKSGKLIAISEEDSDWKFIDYDHAQASAAQGGAQLLPEEIAKALTE